MLAAFMSTHDSYLLCWASVIVEDVVNPLSGNRLSMRVRLTLARVLIFGIGMFLLGWSIWYPMRRDMLDYLAVSGAIYFTGAFAVLLAGLYWQRASRVGAYGALLAGALAILGLDPVQRALGLTKENLGGVELSEAKVGLFTAAVALILMLIGSILFPDRQRVGET